MSEHKLPRDFIVWNQIGFNAGTMEQMMEKVFRLPVSPQAAVVALAGVPALIDAQRDPALAEIYNSATMTVVDGMPIVKRARKLGLECDRFSGPDFMRPFFAKCLPEKKRHFFYGCTEDVLRKLKANLERDFPGIEICGTYAPPFRELTEEEEERVLRLIRRSRPDFLWIGLGGKKQERWMHMHRSRLEGCVMLGVGAGFNYLAGTLAEMPRWMVDHSLGWLFRLCQEPGRLWKRYVIGGFCYLYYNLLYGARPETRDRLLSSAKGSEERTGVASAHF